MPRGVSLVTRCFGSLASSSLEQNFPERSFGMLLGVTVQLEHDPEVKTLWIVIALTSLPCGACSCAEP